MSGHRSGGYCTVFERSPVVIDYLRRKKKKIAPTSTPVKTTKPTAAIRVLMAWQSYMHLSPLFHGQCSV